MATAKFSDFTAVLGSNLASGDLLLVSRVGGSTSAKLSMSELRSYLDGFYSVLAHTHGLSTLTGDTFTAGQLIAGTGAGGLLSKVNAGAVGSVLGWTTSGAITSITPSMPGHTHAFSDIGVGTTSGVGFGMSAGSSTASGAVLNIQGGTVGKSIETFDETSTSRFSVSTYGIVVGRLFSSSVTTGTAPLIINSTTVCTNLNADLLDGSHASAFATSSHTHGMSSLTGDTFTAGQLMGGTGAGGLLSKVSAGTSGQCLGWTTGGAFTAITPGTGSGGSTVARILFSATALDSIGTNGASLLNLGDATTARLCRGFDDTTETYAYGSFQVPSNINTSGTVTWNAVGGLRSATTGNVLWTFGERESATGEAWTGAYAEYDSAATAFTGATTTQFAVSWSTTASTLGWASGDLVRFRVSRDPSASGDATGDALLDYFYIDIPTS